MLNSQGGDYKVYHILGYYAVQWYRELSRLAETLFPVFTLEVYSTVKVGAAGSSETSEIFYYNRRRYRPEDSNLN